MKSKGAEIDLILRRGDALYGVECKRTDTPRLTPSIRIALDDLNLKHVFVIYPGTQRFPLASQVEAVPLQTLVKGVSLFNDL
jgi:predicted AAA+ superfamily ATPase